MKNIIRSGMLVFMVAVIAGYATFSFFSDEEKSEGNTFTAGAIDLKVDHLKQTYNGIDCETCSVDVFSSTATKVVDASDTAYLQALPANAVEVSNPNPAWQNEAALAPAQWIWATNPTRQEDTTNNAEYTFENKFQWNGNPVGVDLSLALAADNGYKIILNGTTIVDKIGTQYNYATAVQLTSGQETTFMSEMESGENVLQIVVRNMAYPGGPSGNPAGLLFKLNVQRNQQECEADSYFQDNCRLWGEKDLALGDKFWNFDDIKPGDSGTNVISLHPYDNDAFVCMRTANKQDLENGLTEPETSLGDIAPAGELYKYLNLFVWDDLDGDGVYEPTGEDALYSGNFDGLNGGISRLAIPGNGSDNLGIAWCVGNQTVDGGTGVISCAGGGADHNDAQTDQLIADLVFYAVQQRNNGEFSCLSLNK